MADSLILILIISETFLLGLSKYIFFKHYTKTKNFANLNIAYNLHILERF